MSKAEQGVFLGYAHEDFGNRLWDLVNKKPKSFSDDCVVLGPIVPPSAVHWTRIENVQDQDDTIIRNEELVVIDDEHLTFDIVESEQHLEEVFSESP